jgi:peptidoglycan/xylan/chitin deacetylase (PgdA/CDA1 family)
MESLERETAASRARLEAVTGKAVRYFAYPFGAQDSAAQAAVASAGFEAAFAGDKGSLGRFAVPRIVVAGDGAFWLGQRLRGRLFRLKRTLPGRLGAELGRRVRQVRGSGAAVN